MKTKNNNLEKMRKKTIQLEAKMDDDKYYETKEHKDEEKKIQADNEIEEVDINIESGEEEISEKDISYEDAKNIGSKLGTKWDKFSIKQFRKGLNFEMDLARQNEDSTISNDPQTTGKIVLAHLNESPDYYDRFDQMNQETV